MAVREGGGTEGTGWWAGQRPRAGNGAGGGCRADAALGAGRESSDAGVGEALGRRAVCAARRRGAATRLGAGGSRPGAPQVQEVAPDRGRVAPEITWRGPLPTARLSSRHCTAGRNKWHPMTKTPLQHWLGGHK